MQRIWALTACVVLACCSDTIEQTQPQVVLRITPFGSLVVGASHPLTAVRVAPDGAISPASPDWATNDSTVVSITPSGIVSARKIGTARIRASLILDGRVVSDSISIAAVDVL